MADPRRFGKRPDIELTPDEIAELMPYMAEHMHGELPGRIVMMPSIVDEPARDEEGRDD